MNDNEREGLRAMNRSLNDWAATNLGVRGSKPRKPRRENPHTEKLRERLRNRLAGKE